MTMTLTEALDAPLDDEALVAAFRAALGQARANGVKVRIVRADNDFEVYRWKDGHWDCHFAGRDSGGGCASVMKP